MSALFDLLAGILAFYYDLVPNYVVAITLLTLTVMVVLTPLTLKGTRSMLAMQKLQPEMKRIQEMHKGDRVAMNEAMMAFYKEHKINPLTGCLPTLMQIPVMIVLFNVVNGLAKTRELADGVIVGAPKYLDHSTELYRALRDSKGKMMAFGVDFAKNPSTAGRGAVVLYLLIGLVVLTSYYQTRQMQARSANNQINPQMQMMTRVMPLMSGLFGFTLPGGVTLYFLVSNLYRIAQQALMYRFDPHLKAHMDEVREVKSRAGSQPSQPRKGLMASMREQAEAREAQRRGADNGASRANGSSVPSSRPTTGRVTQPGQRGNPPRKRSKRKR